MFSRFKGKKSTPSSRGARPSPGGADGRDEGHNLAVAMQQLLAVNRGSLKGEVIARVLSVPPSSVVTNGEFEELFEVSPRPLGQGQISTVFRATRRADSEAFTLKVLNLSALVQSERALLKVRGEVAALRGVAVHAHIVRLHEIIVSPTECALVVDASDDDLLTVLEARGGRLPEAEAAVIFRQVCAAVAHLHQQGWAHRDLKPEHISMMSSSPDSGRSAGGAGNGAGGNGAGGAGNGAGGAQHLHARLVDFGDSSRCELGDGAAARTLRGFCGTPLYMAPEVAAWYNVDGAGAASAGAPSPYGVQCDCWSLGITVYVAVCGEAPWDQDDELAELIASITTTDIQLSSPAWAACSADAKALVRGLLAAQPSRRLTAAQAVEDPWLMASPPTDLDTKQADAPAPSTPKPSASTFPTPGSTPISGRGGPSPPSGRASTPAGEGGASAVSANASALLVAAAEELESMRDRLRTSRLAEAAASSAATANAHAATVAALVLSAEITPLESSAGSGAARASDEASLAEAYERGEAIGRAAAYSQGLAAARAAAEEEVRRLQGMLAAEMGAHVATRAILQATSAVELPQTVRLPQTAEVAAEAVAVEAPPAALAPPAATGINVLDSSLAAAAALQAEAPHAASTSAPTSPSDAELRRSSLFGAPPIAAINTSLPPEHAPELARSPSSSPELAAAPPIWSPVEIETLSPQDIVRLCMSLLIAELAEDDEAAWALRTQLGLTRGETRSLVGPLALELTSRDERIGELEQTEHQLRLDLQQKRQRVAASERSTERASSHADVAEAALLELRGEVHSWKVRCAAVEASLQEATHSGVFERTVHEEQVRTRDQQLRELTARLTATEEDLKREMAARDEAIARRDEPLSNGALRPTAAPRSPPVPSPPPVASAMRESALVAEVANCELRRQLSVRIAAEDDAVARRAVDVHALSRELGASERAVEVAFEAASSQRHATTGGALSPSAAYGASLRGLALESARREERAAEAGLWENRVKAAAAASAASARAQTELEWRAHLSRAVLLTREEDRAAPLPTSLKARTPDKYLEGAKGRLALLDDLGGLAQVVADVKGQANCRYRSAPTGGMVTPTGALTRTRRNDA